MGENNSSKCVVCPVFDELLSTCGATGRPKIVDFLTLVLPPGFDVGHFSSEAIWYDGHQGERVLKPQPAFLEWCRNNIQELCRPDVAATRLKVNPKYKFEGGTHPDVYIKTNTCHVVIEAKWTEPRITAYTTWRKEGERDQLIRHMDALVGADGLPVFGLFLIDAHRKISKVDIERRFRDDHYIKTSVPHRIADKSWQFIKNGYRGVFTWQELREKLVLRVPKCKAFII